MAPLTQTRPKPLIEVAGKPLIDHAMQYASDLSVRVINLHYKGEMIRQHLSGQKVLFSDETTQILETGGGLRHALPLLGPDPVYTLNTDAVWAGPNPLHVLRDHWDSARMEALLLLIDPNRATGHSGQGDFAADRAGRLTRGPGAIYSGAQILSTDHLGDFAEPVFSLNRVWDGMIARGGLFGVTYPGRWCDVGRPTSIALAEAMLASADV